MSHSKRPASGSIRKVCKKRRQYKPTGGGTNKNYRFICAECVANGKQIHKKL